MKNILIVSHAMELGGAESALIGLLDSFDYKEYNVDLFLFHHSGELMELIPKEVNLLPVNKKYASLAVPFSEVIHNKAFLVGLGRYIGNKKAMKYVEKNNISDGGYVYINYSHKYTKKFMPVISQKKYDLAISFLTPHYFVSEKVEAKKKIAWIHTDYNSITVDADSELQMWKAFDNIISISDSVTDSFLQKYPGLENKIVMIENIHPAELIKKRSEEFSANDEMSDDCIKILSVGRFCYPKNFDNVPYICRKIIESGINVKWYLVGFGPDEELIKEKIAEENMQDKVIILGKKSNPYPYFKACDFYIQPSRYEGNSVTVNEALILKKPVVITNYATSSSQINNGVDGVIVPLENDWCAKGIADFISNKELQQKIKSKLENSDYSKSDEIKKLYSIINGC